MNIRSISRARVRKREGIGASAVLATVRLEFKETFEKVYLRTQAASWSNDPRSIGLVKDGIDV